MPKYNRDKDYDNSYNSGLYGKDSLDHYNEDLSKKAVGSIFSNIERGDSYNNAQNTDNVIIDTNFNVKSNDQRKKLVNDLYDDSEDYEQKRRPKQVRPKQTVISKRTITTNTSNSALSRDDDTMAVKYVTRGNHQAVTPAAVSRRKDVTMVESQRIPIITDEEIASYKKQNTSRHIAYTTTPTKDTTPISYDEFINRNDVTSDQRQIIEHFAQEENKKEIDIENTLYRLTEQNKHADEKNRYYNEIIASTTKRLNDAENNTRSRQVDFDEFEDEYDNEYDNGSQQGFNNNFSQSYDETFEETFEENYQENYEDPFDLPAISREDLDNDYEDTVTSLNVDYEQISYTQRNKLEQPAKQQVNRRNSKTLINSLDDEDYFDVETDSYVTRKSQYTTGEIKKINDTIATEFVIDDIDDLTFSDGTTVDMEFLRNVIKQKSKAQKMQSIDNQLHEFEMEYRNFNAKRNVPPKTVPKNRPTQTQDNVNDKNSQNKNTQDSYEYRKARVKQENSSKYDSNSYDVLDTDTRPNKTSASARHVAVARQASAPVDTAKVNRANTGRQAPVHTSKVQTADLHNDEDFDYGDDYSTKFNVSLIANIILIITLLGGGTYLFLKMSTLSEEVEILTTTNDRLVAESDKIAELQMDLENYKSLYLATPEGQQSLIDANNGNTVDTSSNDTTSSNTSSNTGGGKTYTVGTGDTLSSIAKKVYGNSNSYQKIKDANNLTSDNLKVGQELIIP